MTSHQYQGEKPSYGSVTGFDHMEFWVGNAASAASWFVTRMGFERVAYKGLETGSRQKVTHVVRQGNIFFALSSPLNPDNGPVMGQDMNEHIARHGDGVKVVAFAVEDARRMYESAVERGAESVEEPREETDEHGTVVLATVKTYGDTVHTFVTRGSYNGPFLPGYAAVDGKDPLTESLPAIGLDFIDHCVGNMPDQGMMPVVNWYERVLQFHRFWSVDDKQIHTEYSSLRSVVMADHDERVKMPINEPAKGKRKSQIQEYVEYYGGSGVQHIALSTTNILHAITQLRRRGVDFLRVPDTYYEALRERLSKAGMTIKEDLAEIQRLNILVDFDESGYLLQLFTKPIQDRPTVFIEIIQREGCDGFGAGNFKSLFESIEREQARRGNLTADGEEAKEGEAPAAAAGAGDE